MESLPRWYGETEMTNIIASKILPFKLGIQYFLQVLKTGGVLDSNLVDRHLSQGTFYAIAPDGTDDQRLAKFEVGGILLPEPKIHSGAYVVQAVPTTLPIATSITSKEMAGSDDPVLWIHEPLLTEDEVVAKRLPYQKVGKDLYLVFDRGAGVEVRIKELIQRSLLSWHFLAFLTNGLHQVQSVENLVQCAKLIVVGAYDGESFLYWRLQPSVGP